MAADLDDLLLKTSRTFALATAHGPVHVWVPAGYHPDGAAIVLYVHGYYTGVDKAWIAEAKRRHQELLEGRVKGIPGEQVFANIRALLAR